MALKYIDRQTGEEKIEKVYFEKTLRFLYDTSLGRKCMLLIAHLPFVSRLFGWWQRRSWTRSKIAPFVEKYGIDASEFEKTLPHFISFDDFFTRKLKNEVRPIAAADAVIPADGRYLFYQDISQAKGFLVKGKCFSIKTLLHDPTLSERYERGSMVLGRLCPTDYHRFHFPCDGTPSACRLINGPLHSVNPIAIRKQIGFLIENKRVITEVGSELFGKILYIEIGATNVGTIHQTYAPGKAYPKGAEKGYFSFGGSSIILLFEEGRLQFDRDLLDISARDIEARCHFGQSMGTSLQ